jgi:hypothetical protein
MNRLRNVIFIPIVFGAVLFIASGCAKKDYSETNGPSAAPPSVSQSAPTYPMRHTLTYPSQKQAGSSTH